MLVCGCFICGHSKAADCRDCRCCGQDIDSDYLSALAKIVGGAPRKRRPKLVLVKGSR